MGQECVGREWGKRARESGVSEIGERVLREEEGERKRGGEGKSKRGKRESVGRQSVEKTYPHVTVGVA